MRFSSFTYLVGQGLLNAHFSNKFCHEAYSRVAYDRGI